MSAAQAKEPLVITGVRYAADPLRRGCLSISAIPAGLSLGLAVGWAVSKGGELVPWLPNWGDLSVLSALAGALGGFLVGFFRFQTFLRESYRVVLDDEQITFETTQGILNRVSWEDLRSYRIDRRGWIRLGLGQAHGLLLDLRIPCPGDSATAEVAGRFDERGLPRT